MINLEIDFFSKFNIKKNSTLIVSVSGGIDSMVLLNLLTKFEYKLVVVNFNHLKRKESILEANLVKEYCVINNIDFIYEEIDIKTGNFQNEARKKRIEFLSVIAKSYDTSYIVTAHHLDDLLESILMKISRGSNLFGYAGIHEYVEKNGFIFLKPILSISKDKILSFAIDNHIKYLNDESNFKNDYSRNRYRNQIIPLLKKENPLLLNNIKNYSEQISLSFNYIRGQSKKFISIYKDEVISISELLALDLCIQKDVISCLLEEKDISFNTNIINNTLNILNSTKPNQTISLSKNYTFIKSYNQFYMSKNEEKNTQNIKFKLEENLPLLSNNFTFTFFTKSNNAHNETLKLCYNELELPLWIRYRSDGDILSFSYGHKKLKKLLIDSKVSKEKRDSLILVTDNKNQILYIPNLYINKTLGDKHTLYFEFKEK